MIGKHEIEYAMTKFIKVTRGEGLVLWMQSSPVVEKDPINYAMSRVRSSMSSIIGKKKRIGIYKNYIQAVCKFLGVTYSSSYRFTTPNGWNRVSSEFTIEYYETIDPLVKTAKLNELELYNLAGVKCASETPEFKAAEKFLASIN